MTAVLRPALPGLPAIGGAPGLALILGLTGTPLVAVLATLAQVPSTPLAILTRAAILLASLAMLGRLQGGAALRSLPFWLLSLFWALYLARMAHATLSDPASLSRSPGTYWAFAVGACLLPMLGLALAARPAAMTLIENRARQVMALACPVALILSDTIAIGSTGAAYDSGRHSLTALNPIALGHFSASFALLSYWAGRRQAGHRAVLLALAGFAIGLLGVLMAGSRGPILALLGALLVAETLRGGRVLVFGALALLPGLILLASDPGLIDRALGVQTMARIGTGLRLEDAAALGRVVSFQGAWTQFAQAPWLGDGLEERLTGLYPHNIHLEALMSTGIIGGAALSLGLALLAVQAAGLIRRDAAGAGCGLLFVQYLIAAQFTGAVYTASQLWVLAGVMIALGAGRVRHG